MSVLEPRLPVGAIADDLYTSTSQYRQEAVGPHVRLCWQNDLNTHNTPDTVSNAIGKKRVTHA